MEFAWPGHVILPPVKQILKLSAHCSPRILSGKVLESKPSLSSAKGLPRAGLVQYQDIRTLLRY